MKKQENNTPLPTERNGIYKVGNGVLINRDTEALKAYKTRKRKMNEIETIKEEVSSLKSDMEEIKDLLRSLLK